MVTTNSIANNSSSLIRQSTVTVDSTFRIPTSPFAKRLNPARHRLSALGHPQSIHLRLV
jgi:hypothetical protein